MITKNYNVKNYFVGTNVTDTIIDNDFEIFKDAVEGFFQKMNGK